jgi:hypothetical protein
MADDVDVPCKFADKGCKVTMKIKDTPSHGFDCPFGSATFCKQLIPDSDCTIIVNNRSESILEHLTSKHGAIVVPSADAGLVRQTFASGAPGQMPLQTCPLLCFKYDDKVFLLVTTSASPTNNFLWDWKVFLAGSNITAEQYRARLSLFGPPSDNTYNLTWTGKVFGIDAKEVEAKPGMKLSHTMDDFKDLSVGGKVSFTLAVEIRKESDQVAEQISLRNKTVTEVAAVVQTSLKSLKRKMDSNRSFPCTSANAGTSYVAVSNSSNGPSIPVPPPPAPPSQRNILLDYLNTLRSTSTPDQQQRALQILRSNPQLLTAFIRNRQQQERDPTGQGGT